MPSDAVLVAQAVARVLEGLGVRYLIGGSLASSIYGVPRSTQDVDFVADLPEAQIQALVSALEPDFYIDAAAVRRAVHSGRSFNVIHLATMYKADIFILGSAPHAQEEMRRRRPQALAPGPDAPTAYFCTAEDIVLQKLSWFQKGGGVSERQWDDLLNVLKTQAGGLDYDYLRRWARELGVADLLSRAFGDAGVTGLD